MAPMSIDGTTFNHLGIVVRFARKRLAIARQEKVRSVKADHLIVKVRPGIVLRPHVHGAMVVQEMEREPQYPMGDIHENAA